MLDIIVYGASALLICLGLTLVLGELIDGAMRWIANWMASK